MTVTETSNGESVRHDLKPCMLIISSQENLQNKYGQPSFKQIETKIDTYIQALDKAGIRAVFVYVDSADSLADYSLKPVDPRNASDIKGLLDELDKKLSPAYVLIIGGHSIIPFHVLKNPCDDDDKEVYSDSPYASSDDDIFIPERALTRLPDESSGDVSFLLSLIDNITDRVKHGKQYSFGDSAKVWEEASEAVYNGIKNGQDLKTSPTVISSNLNSEWIDGRGYFYFNLHGGKDTSNWYGQGDNGSLLVAFTPGNLKNVNVENAVVCTEACYGANIIDKGVDDALSLKFLAKKAACFVGSTKIAYGSSELPNTDADLLVLKFFEHIKEGLVFGEAFLKAKQDFAKESIKKGYLDVTEQKTLLEFVIYADPSLRLEDIL